MNPKDETENNQTRDDRHRLTVSCEQRCRRQHKDKKRNEHNFYFWSASVRNKKRNFSLLRYFTIKGPKKNETINWSIVIASNRWTLNGRRNDSPFFFLSSGNAYISKASDKDDRRWWCCWSWCWSLQSTRCTKPSATRFKRNIISSLLCTRDRAGMGRAVWMRESFR